MFLSRLHFVYWVLALAMVACSTSQVGEGAEEGALPNVVFILADDLGVMDIQGYAARFTGADTSRMFYQTPHLNRLMARGVSFSQAYATQLCSPTRAGLLTGKYAPRLGFMTAMPLRETYYNQALPVPAGYYAHDVLDHRDDINIPRAWDNATSNSALPTGAPPDAGRDVLSIAEALTGHHSVFLGKWHIGGFGARGYQPADQGFEPLAWFDGGGSAYYNWRKSWANRSKARFPAMPQETWAIGDPGDSTGQDYLTDDLTAQALQFLSTQAEHPGEKPFFLYLSHFAVHSPYQGKAAEVSRYTDHSTRGWNGHQDPVYASMIRGLDRSLGQILAQLDSSGLADNTLVIFMSDNGGIDRKITPQGDGTDNAPFLGGKACLTEGGIRVPLILYWKGKTAANQWIDTPVDYTDIFPTILAAAGYDAQAVITREDLDGQSLLPFLRPQAGVITGYHKTTRYWHYPFNVIYNSPYDGFPLTPHSAIREGDAKLIFDWHGRLHLYDLARDPYEKTDLAAQDTLTTQRLFRKLHTWLVEHVDERYWPVLNPDYDPTQEVRKDPFQNLLEETVGH
ncbi:sulfatase-like hydrolase/transferase [Neolewinella lacunae]|uniref:Sulfatase-like hydrolase/transferase n=1 Tax=Neolewinella lacunae TaxID=1517758 RepID=A0A923TAV8_9BACT|nr:sulfatase-like hydrolase/transferase [Neolewinella lacunae]MBC6996598.1 sulfatase-like hydrolase/transferase [Neolewinella lacunae]MDN3634838.1 sulfatase-like hydrolase/transferase [Neolewinella lacunae]